MKLLFLLSWFLLFSLIRFGKCKKSHMISFIPFVWAESRQEVSWLSSQESLPCLAEKDANCVWARNCTGVGNVVLLKLAQRSLSSSLEQVHMSMGGCISCCTLKFNLSVCSVGSASLGFAKEKEHEEGNTRFCWIHCNYSFIGKLSI